MMPDFGGLAILAYIGIGAIIVTLIVVAGVSVWGLIEIGRALFL